MPTEPIPATTLTLLESISIVLGENVADHTGIFTWMGYVGMVLIRASVSSLEMLAVGKDFLQSVLNLAGSRDNPKSKFPHQPLLLLLALGRAINGHGRLETFNTLCKPLETLLREFSHPVKVLHPEQPFTFLRKPYLWEIPAWNELKRDDKGTLRKSSLIKQGARAGIPDPVHRLLVREPRLVRLAAQILLDARFPVTIHEDILREVGIPVEPLSVQEMLMLGQGLNFDLPSTSPPRDPAFRGKVLHVYENLCAVCEQDIRLKDHTLGLEAAHIRWHCAEGPDIVQNGLGLCKLHHEALDRGAIGLIETRQGLNINVSNHLAGRGSAFEEMQRLKDQPLFLPRDPDHRPKDSFIKWHSTHVFKP